MSLVSLLSCKALHFSIKITGQGRTTSYCTLKLSWNLFEIREVISADVSVKVVEVAVFAIVGILLS